MRLQDKVIVITGASGGMGRVMAKTFVQEGAKVVAVARREEQLKELQDECKELPGQLAYLAGDCSKEDVCEKMIDYAVETFGRLDGLVNNAGIMDDTTAVGDFKDDLLTKIFDLNTFGVFYAMRKAVKQLLSQERTDPDAPRGTILNITSIGAQHACAGAVYCASKAAVESLTKHSAFMYLQEGIRINAIAPGGVMTDIAMNMPAPDAFGGGRTGTVTALMQRVGESEEIAQSAVFLLSDEASFVNGQVLSVNGGWMCY